MTAVGVGAATATATTITAPAIAKSRIEIDLVTSWGRDSPGAGLNAQNLAKQIESASDGAIKVNYFAAGERVGAFDVFDEVTSGNADAYHAPEYYWKGKHPAYPFFTSVPFGMTTPEMKAWVNHMGGQALWDELAAQFGLKAIASGSNTTQMGGWFNKEVNSPDDLKGLKIRYPGAAGDVMTKLGASAVALPGPQIYENLVSGAIDAAEYIGPYNDYFLKFYEAAKYYYSPGFHEPGGSGALTFNKEFWDKLNQSDKDLINACCAYHSEAEYTEALAKNGEYTRKLVDEHGVVLKEFNEELYEAFFGATEEVYEEIRDHSDFSNKVVDSYMDSMRALGSWGKLGETGYVSRRNEALGI